MKKTIMLMLSWYSVMVMAYGVNTKPYCLTPRENRQMVIAYLGADSSWKLKDTDLATLQEQLSHVTLVNYSFIRLSHDEDGNTLLRLAPQDIENIQTLRELRPDLPIMIAVGGWGEREGFTPMLEDEAQMSRFVQSVKQQLAKYHLDGIDVDWENELLASEKEIQGAAKLMQHLHESLSADGYCLSNAVPATSAYWQHYPNASLWQSAVNWTTIMAYDHYGTFGPRTELGAALYDDGRREDTRYPYPSTSGHAAVMHYYQQGLAAQKIILGLPFYCHSYYVQNSQLAHNEMNPGLQVKILDPNISSQVNYNEAYHRYGRQLVAYAYQDPYGKKANEAGITYGLIPLANTAISRFMSCESPQSVLQKVAYVEGANALSTHRHHSIKLGGVSFWSLQQDLPFSHPFSLLAAIHQGFGGQ